MNIQWYPGHMTKAKRAMKEDIKLIDLVIELVDARMPLGSRNPDIDELARGKGRMILLNKADLADEGMNEQWTAWFRERGFHVVKINARTGAGLKQISPLVQEACREKIERDRRKGIKNRPVRAMVVGIPNVGKSTFINSFAGKACAKTGNRPGVTKGNQWIRLNRTLELLDTPGILWPKFEDQTVGLNLAFIGSINDEIIDRTELAAELAGCLLARYRAVLEARYQLEPGREYEPYQVLEQVARVRACLLKGSELDLKKAAGLFLDDFRSGRLGRITLEVPEAKDRDKAKNKKNDGEGAGGKGQPASTAKTAGPQGADGKTEPYQAPAGGGKPEGRGENRNEDA